MVYLKDEQGNYINCYDHVYPVDATDETKEPMSEAMAKSFIAINPTWEMEEVK